MLESQPCRVGLVSVRRRTASNEIMLGVSRMSVASVECGSRQARVVVRVSWVLCRMDVSMAECVSRMMRCVLLGLCGLWALVGRWGRRESVVRSLVPLICLRVRVGSVMGCCDCMALAMSSS